MGGDIVRSVITYFLSHDKNRLGRFDLVLTETNVTSIYVYLLHKLMAVKSNKMAVLIFDLSSPHLNNSFVLLFVINKQLDISNSFCGITNTFIVIP